MRRQRDAPQNTVNPYPLSHRVKLETTQRRSIARKFALYMLLFTGRYRTHLFPFLLRATTILLKIILFPATMSIDLSTKIISTTELYVYQNRTIRFAIE